MCIPLPPLRLHWLQHYYRSVRLGAARRSAEIFRSTTSQGGPAEIYGHDDRVKMEVRVELALGSSRRMTSGSEKLASAETDPYVGKGGPSTGPTRFLSSEPADRLAGP